MPEYKGILSTVLLLVFSGSAVADATELSWVGGAICSAAYIEDLAKGFEQQTGTRIHLNLSDSTSGIRDVQRGTADLGSATRYLLPNDPRESGVEIIPVAWDALTIVVHRDNPVTDISLQQLRDIYSGKITNWSDLGGADLKIDALIHHEGNTSSGSALREIIFEDRNRKFRAGRLMNAADSVSDLMSEHPGAVALTGVSYARAHELKTLSLDGIAPAIDTIKSGDYSLYRPLYLTYNRNSANIDSIKNFISYINSKDAREKMRANGVVPYTDAMGLVMKKVRANEATYPQSVDKI